MNFSEKSSFQADFIPEIIFISQLLQPAFKTEEGHETHFVQMGDESFLFEHDPLMPEIVIVTKKDGHEKKYLARGNEWKKLPGPKDYHGLNRFPEDALNF